jgi:hypothetical protein
MRRRRRRPRRRRVLDRCFRALDERPVASACALASYFSATRFSLSAVVIKIAFRQRRFGLSPCPAVVLTVCIASWLPVAVRRVATVFISPSPCRRSRFLASDVGSSQ